MATNYPFSKSRKAKRLRLIFFIENHPCESINRSIIETYSLQQFLACISTKNGTKKLQISEHKPQLIRSEQELTRIKDTSSLKAYQECTNILDY